MPAPGVRWQLLVADLDGRNLGEIANARDRSLFWRLNGIPNLTFRVDSENPRSDELLSGDVLVKAMRTRRADEPGDEPWLLQEIYDVTTAEEVAQGDQSDGVSVVCEGPFARLGPGGDAPGRLIGKSAAGVTYANVDIGAVMGTIITTVNAEGGDTGLLVGTIVPSAPAYAGPWYYKPAGEAIAELSATLDGPDFQVVALEPTANGGKVGAFEAAPALGTLRDTLFFEYGEGTKTNVRFFRRPVDGKGVLNRAYALPPGFPEATAAATGVAMAQDLGSQALRGLREAVVSTDLGDLSLRNFLAAEHIRIRALPRQTIVFDPHVHDPANPLRTPEFPIDYDVGDLVQARAKVGGRERFDAWFRLYGLTLTLDDVGKATPQVALLPEGQS